LGATPFLTSNTFTLGGLRGTILVAAGVSAFLYLMNLFVKLATSSYHLARDARERYQLTYVFLALEKDGSVTPKDREVILTALFSRADTGLLKNDSSPSMPTPWSAIIQGIKEK
jgi:hypothetical protein